MSTVHICLNDILGVAVSGCEVIFHPGDTPFASGSTLAVSGARSVRLDAEGNGSVTLLSGRYSVRFSGIVGNTDTLLMQVPDDDESYELTSLICGGNWVLPMRDFLQKANNLEDVADAAAAFDAIKQAAAEGASGVVQLASQAEVDAETEASKVVTPVTLAGRLATLPTGGAAVKLVTVANATARKALTASAVNVGDVVEELDTRDCYAVLDTTLLGDDAGFVKIGTRATTSTGGGSIALLTDLVGYWKLDGNGDDASGNGWTLSATNSPGFVSGKIGQAASFDGTNYLSSADLTATMGGQSLTVSCWAKFDASLQIASTPGLVNSWAGGGVFNLHLWQDGGAYQVRFAPGSTNATEAVAPSDLGWHHYVARFDADTGDYDLWIDGAQAAQQTGGALGTDWTRGIRVGQSDDRSSARLTRRACGSGCSRTRKSPRSTTKAAEKLILSLTKP